MTNAPRVEDFWLDNLFVQYSKFLKYFNHYAAFGRLSLGSWFFRLNFNCGTFDLIDFVFGSGKSFIRRVICVSVWGTIQDTPPNSPLNRAAVLVRYICNAFLQFADMARNQGF